MKFGPSPRTPRFFFPVTAKNYCTGKRTPAAWQALWNGGSSRRRAFADGLDRGLRTFPRHAETIPNFRPYLGGVGATQFTHLRLHIGPGVVHFLHREIPFARVIFHGGPFFVQPPDVVVKLRDHPREHGGELLPFFVREILDALPSIR